jgi:hypothetical protein
LHFFFSSKRFTILDLTVAQFLAAVKWQNKPYNIKMFVKILLHPVCFQASGSRFCAVLVLNVYSFRVGLRVCPNTNTKTKAWKQWETQSKILMNISPHKIVIKILLYPVCFQASGSRFCAVLVSNVYGFRVGLRVCPNTNP